MPRGVVLELTSTAVLTKEGWLPVRHGASPEIISTTGGELLGDRANPDPESLFHLGGEVPPCCSSSFRLPLESSSRLRRMRGLLLRRAFIFSILMQNGVGERAMVGGGGKSTRVRRKKI